MKEYVFSVSLAIILCVIVNLMVPSPKYTGIMKIVCGLVVVNTLINPIKGVFFEKNIYYEPNIFDGREEFDAGAYNAKEDFDELMIEMGEDTMSLRITSDLKKRWNNRIEVTVEDGAARIQNANSGDFADIERYIKKHYGLKTVFG